MAKAPKITPRERKIADFFNKNSKEVEAIDAIIELQEKSLSELQELLLFRSIKKSEVPKTVLNKAIDNYHASIIIVEEALKALDNNKDSRKELIEVIVNKEAESVESK